MTTNLQEGNLLFAFSSETASQKYDTMSFYRNQFQSACYHNKGVDFICLSDDTAWLIEVKDFRKEGRKKEMPLADEVAMKVRDTLAGLVAAKVNANDREERAFCKQTLRKTMFRVVLHLEYRKETKIFSPISGKALFLQKLKQNVRALDPHPIVMSMDDMRKNVPWTVSPV